MNAVDIAKGGQFAENKFMNKPSGLMDQMASSVGGFVSIDFKDPKTPIIVPVNFDIASAGFSLCVVDTKGSHSNLTDAYAGIPKEMKSVANYFGKEVLRDVDESEFYKRIPTLRKEIGDRPVLRAIHFFEENKRALQEAEQLRNGDFSGFLQSVKDSGNSSYKFLQNIYAYPDSQAVSVAIAVSEKVLGALGAVRVHGGGFAGTIQAFVPNALLDAYKRELDYVFGEDSCHVLNIRAVGGVAFDLPSYV
jgi:galactokinase